MRLLVIMTVTCDSFDPYFRFLASGAGTVAPRPVADLISPFCYFEEPSSCVSAGLAGWVLQQISTYFPTSLELDLKRNNSFTSPGRE